jgi:hypothetical protein
MSTIAILDAQSSVSRSSPNPCRDDLDLIDIYDLADVDLDPYTGLIIEGMLDQEHLHRHRHIIHDYLATGRVVIFSGQLFRPWLPGCGLFVPKQIRSHHDYEIKVVTPHPIFHGVTSDYLTRRRGVAGFFARGHHPPPPQAEILLTLAGGEPVVYIDRSTTAGVILAHSGHSLLGWGEPGSPAAHIDTQLLAWIRDEGTVS